MNLSETQLEKIHVVWDQLVDYAVTDMREACCHLMGAISEWIGASHAGWVGAARMCSGADSEQDVLFGWRQRGIILLHPLCEQEAALIHRIMHQPLKTPGLTSVAMARNSGNFRVHSLRDGFVDLEEFCRTQHYRDFYETLEIADRIWVGFPVSESTESIFLFDKRKTSDLFSADDLAVVRYALRGIRWFHRQVLCSQGMLLATAPLTPVERLVLRELLTEKSEKEIAAALQQSVHTTHGHVKQIYRKFGVNNRAGLMALWLATI